MINTASHICCVKYSYAWNQRYAEWLHSLTQLFTSDVCGPEMTSNESQSIFMWLREAKCLQRPVVFSVFPKLA